MLPLELSVKVPPVVELQKPNVAEPPIVGETDDIVREVPSQIVNGLPALTEAGAFTCTATLLVLEHPNLSDTVTV